MLFIAGAGGFGRETYDAVLATADLLSTAGQDIEVAFLDDGRAGQKVRDLAVLAPDDADADGQFVVAIANPEVRRRLAELLAGRGLTARTVAHPRAVVGPETTIGNGSVILALAHVLLVADEELLARANRGPDQLAHLAPPSAFSRATTAATECLPASSEPMPPGTAFAITPCEPVTPVGFSTP